MQLDTRYLFALLAFFFIMIITGAIPGEASALSARFGDKLLHTLAYGFMAAVCFHALVATPLLRAVLTVVAIALLCVIDESIQSLLPYRMIGKFRRIGEDRARDMHKMNAKKKMRELIDAKPEEVEKKVREYAEMMYDYLVTDGGDMSIGWIMSHSIHLHLIPAVSTGRFYYHLILFK